MKKIRNKIFIIILLLSMIAVASFVLLSSPIKKEVILEAGNELNIDLFKTKDNQALEFLTDISKINTNQIGQYEIDIKYNDQSYLSTLIIQDTVAPTASPQTITAAVNQLPEAIDCVKDIEDATKVSAAYKEDIDLSSVGEVKAIIVLTDEGNNITEVQSTFHVIEDTKAPVIEGLKNIFVSVGDTISYRNGITVSDNCDLHVELVIDNSEVNLDKVGIYKVVYKATDASNNHSEETIKVYVEEKNITKDKVYEKCDEILASITNENMSQMEVAFEIYKWTKTHIGYANSTEKSSWIKGAYQGLFKHQGDCYTYFATCKALLTRAGIDNIDIERNRIKVQHHYWSLINIGDGWYHIDTTPRLEEGDNFFMCTTEDLQKFKKGTHRFDQSLYPEISTKSIQHLIDYDKGILLID